MALPRYILFLDTETSGVPKRWNTPVSRDRKWPYILQISWIVYKSNGEKVKTENHYIKTGHIKINKYSQQIHGITNHMLQSIGKERKDVIALLAADFELYKPLIVGHFLEFDKKMLDVGFYRAGLQNQVSELSAFCTMKLTHDAHLADNGRKHLRLSELYYKLFSKEQPSQHNAFGDAEATAACFFELERQGIINDQVISDQKEKVLTKKKSGFTPIKSYLFWGLIVALILLFIKIFKELL